MVLKKNRNGMIYQLIQSGGGEYDHFYVKVTPCWLWDGEWDLKWVLFPISCFFFKVYNFYGIFLLLLKWKLKKEEERGEDGTPASIL